MIRPILACGWETWTTWTGVTARTTRDTFENKILRLISGPIKGKRMEEEVQRRISGINGFSISYQSRKRTENSVVWTYEEGKMECWRPKGEETSSKHDVTTRS